jgi:hypothetical protein
MRMRMALSRTIASAAGIAASMGAGLLDANRTGGTVLRVTIRTARKFHDNAVRSLPEER